MSANGDPLGLFGPPQTSQNTPAAAQGAAVPIAGNSAILACLTTPPGASGAATGGATTAVLSTAPQPFLTSHLASQPTANPILSSLANPGPSGVHSVAAAVLPQFTTSPLAAQLTASSIQRLANPGATGVYSIPPVVPQQLVTSPVAAQQAAPPLFNASMYPSNSQIIASLTAAAQGLPSAALSMQNAPQASFAAASQRQANPSISIPSATSMLNTVSPQASLSATAGGLASSAPSMMNTAAAHGSIANPGASSVYSLTASKMLPQSFMPSLSSLADPGIFPGPHGASRPCDMFTSKPVKRRLSQTEGRDSSAGPSSSRPRLDIPLTDLTCHEFIERMMKYCIAEVIADVISTKALESLYKKIKERESEMASFIGAVETEGAEPGGCVLIPKTLDGRLQVNGKKGFPHVIFYRMFRDQSVNKMRIKSIPDLCEHGFNDADTKESSPTKLSGEPLGCVCVNPWHYEKYDRPAPNPPDDKPSTSCINWQEIMSRYESPSSSMQQVQLPQSSTADDEPYQQPTPSNRMQQIVKQFERMGRDHQSSIRLGPPQSAGTQAPIPVPAQALLDPGQYLQQPVAAPPVAQMPESSAELQRKLRIQWAIEHAAAERAQDAEDAKVPGPARGEAASVQFQEIWERRVKRANLPLFYAWKQEERRLSFLEPPRFMHIREWPEVEAWYAAFRVRERSLLPGSAPGSFDPNITAPIPAEYERLGYLVRLLPDGMRRTMEENQMQHMDSVDGAVDNPSSESANGRDQVLSISDDAPCSSSSLSAAAPAADNNEERRKQERAEEEREWQEKRRQEEERRRQEEEERKEDDLDMDDADFFANDYADFEDDEETGEGSTRDGIDDVEMNEEAEEQVADSNHESNESSNEHSPEI